MIRQVNISIEVEDYEVLKSFCEKAKVPMTIFFTGYAQGIVLGMKAKGYHKKARLTKLDILKFVGNSCFSEP
jgi:hypothetical protein